MAANDNSVNIKNDKRYHHGDLRCALIAQGLSQLAAGGAGGLSLRGMARAVGVSPTAVYRHFPDKQALLDALCSEGGRLLAQAQRHAFAQAGGGEVGVVATGRAYVHFAMAHPALFRLMMTSEGPRRESEGLNLLRAHIREASNRPTAKPDGAQAGAETVSSNPEMAKHAAPAADRAADGSDPDQLSLRVTRAWALVHGLAMLILDGQIPADAQLIDALIIPPP